MKKLVIAFLTVIFLLAIFAQSSDAHWRRYRYYPYPYGWYDPFWPYPYSWAYPFGLPPVVVPQQPVVIQPQPQPYIQREPEQPQQNFWHRCFDPVGYWPYIQKCNHEWVKEIPQPPPSAPR